MSGDDSVFLFEYATCGASQELNPSITVEGLGMFKTLLEGFRKTPCRPITFIDQRIPYFRGYPRVSNHTELFSDYIDSADFSLIIAPETGLELYNLTKELEKSGSANLGSHSKAVYETTDKYETSKKLRGVAMPKTEIFDRKTTLGFPLVAKPRDGVSCEGIFLVKSEAELEKVPNGYLLQEFVEGQAMSASLLVGDEIKVLSINTQEINDFVYTGAKIPVQLENCEEIFKAVERIKGLFGYVGVDFVLDKWINIIEINSRPTTPIIALNDVFGFNISELILKNYYKEKIPGFKAVKKVHLKKVKTNFTRAKNSTVSFKNYSILVEELHEDINP